MSSNGDDPNPWFFGNELTINGCSASRDSAPASSTSGVTNNPGKPPASDRQPPGKDPNASLGNNRFRSTQKPGNSSSAPVDKEYTFQSLKDEPLTPRQYSLRNDALHLLPSTVMPRGCQLGSPPREMIDQQEFPRQNIPRSQCAHLDDTLLEKYYASVANGSTDPQVQSAKPSSKLKLESMRQPQGMTDPPEPRNPRGQNVKNRTIKQYRQGSQSRAQEYRQIDTDKDPEEDAETDAGPPQDPSLDGNYRET